MNRLMFLTALLIPAVASAQVQDPPQWNSTSSFLGGGLVRASDGNYYRALKTNINHNPATDGHVFWEIYYVRAPVTLIVATSGDRFQTFKSAWDMVASATIASNISATIEFNTRKGAFQESYGSAFSLNATSGSQIFIEGDSASRIHFTFTGTSSGFVLDHGHHLGALVAVTIQSNPKGGFAGLSLDQQSSIATVQANTIDGFAFGMFVNHGSTMVGSGCTLTGFTSAGIESKEGSSVEMEGSLITGTGSGSVGIQANDFAYIDSQNTRCTHCFEGFRADENGHVRAGGTTADHCLEDGYVSVNSGFIDAHNGNSNNNGGHGYACATGGKILATGATAANNGATDFSPTPNQITSDGSYLQH